MKRTHQVTIKDIARELKISVSTVSRAFRNTHDVGKETREKVLAKARELNYRPNFNAMGLVNHKSHNIAIILPTVTNFYFSTVITGIQEIAYHNGFNIILHITGESPEREIAIADNLPLSSVDGLLVCLTLESNNSNHYQRIIDSGVPIVFFDRISRHINASTVTQNDYGGAFTAVEHLIENGYKKIAHIGGSLSLTFTKERLRGYLDCLKKYQLPTKYQWIINTEFTQGSGYSDTRELLDLKERPEAIFAVNDRKAVGASLALKEEGIEIGEEMGIVGFTNDPISGLVSPALTTVEEPALEVGRKSCELLLKHIRKKNYPATNIVLDGKLIIRESACKQKMPQRILP